MSRSSKRKRRWTTVIGVFIGLIIIFTFMISLLAPNLGSGNNSSSDLYPTITPFGTLPPPTPIVFPTPDPDPQMAGELPYIHSSGYFQTFRPAGADWVINEGESAAGVAFPSAIMQSPTRLVVIHNYIQPGVEYTTLESLSEHVLTAAAFAGSWEEYDSWQEIEREITGDSVIIDFDLVAQTMPYRGRISARLEENWLFVSRLIVPDNNPALLDLLQTLVAPAFMGYPELQQLPQVWPAYSDQDLGFAFKHPPTWARIAGGQGRPVTFTVPLGSNRATVRVWKTDDQPLRSSEQAAAWVTQMEETAEMVEIEPVERVTGSGYQVAYHYRDSTGDPQSGLVVLLNDAAGDLLSANLQLDLPDVNLLDVENLSEPIAEVRQAVVDGFIVLPEKARTP